MEILTNLNPAAIFALLSIILAVLNLLLWIMVWSGVSGTASGKEGSAVDVAVKNLNDRLDENMERNLRLEDQIWGIIDKFKEQEKILQLIKTDVSALKGIDTAYLAEKVEKVREDVLNKIEGVLSPAAASGGIPVEKAGSEDAGASDFEDILSQEDVEELPDEESALEETADMPGDESLDLSESADILDEAEQEVPEEASDETIDPSDAEELLYEGSPDEGLADISELEDILDENILEENADPIDSGESNEEADDSIKNINFNLDDLAELRDEDLDSVEEDGKSDGPDIPDLIEDEDLTDEDK